MSPCGVVIKFKERNGEELHVFGNSQNFYGKDVSIRRGNETSEKRRTTLGHLHKKKFLALFRFGDMSGNKWILCARGWIITFESAEDENTRVTYHKGLEVGAPPLGEAVSNFPVVVDPVGGVELTRITGRGQSII